MNIFVVYADVDDEDAAVVEALRDERFRLESARLQYTESCFQQSERKLIYENNTQERLNSTVDDSVETTARRRRNSREHGRLKAYKQLCSIIMFIHTSSYTGEKKYRVRVLVLNGISRQIRSIFPDIVIDVAVVSRDRRSRKRIDSPADTASFARPRTTAEIRYCSADRRELLGSSAA